MRRKTDYYLNRYGDQCPAYDPNSPYDPYPGQPADTNGQKYPESLFNPYQYGNRRQDGGEELPSCKSPVIGENKGECRVLDRKEGDNSYRLRCDTECQVSSDVYNRLVANAKIDTCEGNEPSSENNDACDAAEGIPGGNKLY